MSGRLWTAVRDNKQETTFADVGPQTIPARTPTKKRPSYVHKRKECKTQTFITYNIAALNSPASSRPVNIRNNLQDCQWIEPYNRYLSLPSVIRSSTSPSSHAASKAGTGYGTAMLCAFFPDCYYLLNTFLYNLA